MRGERSLQVLGDAGRSLGRAVLEGLGRTVSRVQEAKPLQSDLLEGEDAYLAVFDAPGATATDVQVRFADGTVRIRVDRFRDPHEDFELVYPGRGLSLDGRVRLPRDAVVDPDAASATLRSNGTLEVRVPKVAGDGNDREVPVEAEDETEE